MQEERLAEFLERYHSGESNAATSRELECIFSIKGIEVRQMVNRLRRRESPSPVVAAGTSTPLQNGRCGRPSPI